MIKTVTDTAKEVAPPLIISATSFLGVAFSTWVYILTGLYTAVQILRLVPKIIGCGICFCKHKTCTLQCKPGNTTI